MPSLSALGEFKSSFNNIANEKKDVLAKKLPFDDLVLPENEPPPLDLSTETPSSGLDFDFNALLNTIADENSPPSIDNILQDINPAPIEDSAPSDDSSAASSFSDLPESVDAPADTPLPDSIPSDDSPGTESGNAADTAEDDYSVPDGLLSGLSEDLESIKENGDIETEDAQSEDNAIDMGGESLSAAADSGIDDGLDGGFDLGGEMPHELASESSGGELDHGDSGIDMGGESLDTGGESLDMGGESLDMGGESLDMGGESLDMGGESSLGDIPPEPLPDEGSVSGADLPGLEDTSADIDFSGIEPAADAGLDSGGGTVTAAENESPPDAGTDGPVPFDLGDLGSDFASDSITLGGDSEPQSGIDFDSGGFGGGDINADEFSLPGLDDIFDKSKTDTAAQPASKKGLFKKKKAKAEELPEAETDIDEISLTKEEVDRLLKTLATYPLNLRITCEEIIAEQVILPQQLSRLIRLLVNGAHVKETASLVEEITGKPVVIPKSFEKMTGAAFEAEQSSFAYIFVHNFLPVLRLFAVIAALAASVVYLGYKFVYIPLRAESLYKRGYERIPAGEYQRANELFHDAFVLHRNKKWFYTYAEAFRNERRYMLSENKYDELLRYYPRDKKGVLDYAGLETYYLMNYEKANRLLQMELLDYATYDYEGLLAAGDNFLAWADSDPSRFYDKYEDARFSYARLLEKYDWKVPIVERMMKYFIRTDNLKETLYLRVWFENGRNRKLSAESLSELGGYLLDKQLEKPEGVPNPYVESITSVREMLLQAVREEPTLPEPHYHLARYHKNLGNTYEERLTLENAIRAFNLAQIESVRRRLYRVDTHFRYANLLTDHREFFPADEQLVRGIELYEDFLSRNLISATPQLGQLYAARGDLEYFTRTGNMEAALTSYRLAERYGYSPPEIQYRMGSAYYQLENWGSALQYLFRASSELPFNRRLLYALGNTAYQRGDYFAAEGYFSRLLNILENQRVRLPVLLPNDNPQFHELGLRLMWARNNAGVVYEALAEQTGNREYRSKAMVLYAESSLAWDPITRNAETMVRMNLTGSPGAPGINLGYFNANNALRPVSDYNPQIFVHIDKDVLEPSRWEELAPVGGMAN